MDYIDIFGNLRSNQKWGRKSPHKAVLMLTVIELFEQNVLSENEIRYDETLKAIYIKVWNRVFPDEPLFRSEAYLPFWYLQSDSFWHIVPVRGKEDILSLMRDVDIKPSEAKLIDCVKYAELDDDLYFLMTLPSGRSSLKRALLETYSHLSKEQIDRMAESEDNVVDHSLSAMNEYEQILLSNHHHEKSYDDECSSELEKQFKELSDDLQIALSYEYFSFLKNHRSEREMLREVCPNVYALYDCIINNPLRQTDISPSITYIYDNFLCDLKIALMSENGSVEIIDKIEKAIADLRGNDVADYTTEIKDRIDNTDETEEQETAPIYNKGYNDNKLEVEHVYLDPSYNIVKTVTTSSLHESQEKEEITENRKGKPWTQEEEERITHYFERGISTADIAERVGRTEVAIKARLAKLGLIEYTYGENNNVLKAVNGVTIIKDNFKIENSFTKCYILNRKGEKVFSADGKLVFIHGMLYRLNLKDECFTIKDMCFNGEIWMKGNKKIVAYPNTTLYRVLNRANKLEESIEDIADNIKYTACKVKAGGVWYDYKGDALDEVSNPVWGTKNLSHNNVEYSNSSTFVPKGQLKKISEIAGESYDFLLTMAVIEFMKFLPQPVIITFDRLACMMIAIAWEILNEYEDIKEKEEQLCDCIEFLIAESKEEMAEVLNWNTPRKTVYLAIKDYPMADIYEDTVDTLTAKAPYNILRAWINETEDEEITRSSNSPSATCLFAIHPMKRNPYIEIKQGWMRYLAKEHDELINYYKKQYLDFLH